MSNGGHFYEQKLFRKKNSLVVIMERLGILGSREAGGSEVWKQVQYLGRKDLEEELYNGDS